MDRHIISIKDIGQSTDDEPRGDFVRNVILDRAIELFLQKGFSATSMNELAAACKVSKPALYHYVPSKAALLEMLYEHITHDFFAVMTDLRTQPLGPLEKLRKLIINQGIYNIRQRSFLTVFWRERSYFDAEAKKSLARRERDFELWVTSIIEKGCALGEFDVQDSQLATMSLLGMLSSIHRWAHHIEKAPEKISSELADLIINGLTGSSRKG